MTGDFNWGAVDKPEDRAASSSFEQSILYYLYHIARAQYEKAHQAQRAVHQLEWIGNQYQPPPDTVTVRDGGASGPYP